MTISNSSITDIRSWCMRPHDWEEILFDNLTTVGNPRKTVAPKATAGASGGRRLQNYEEPEEEDPTFENTRTNCTEEDGDEDCPIYGLNDDEAFTQE